MKFAYRPSVQHDGILGEDLIDKDNGNLTVASDVEEEYQPLLEFAPELLVACEELMEEVECADNQDHSVPIGPKGDYPWRAKIRAIIASAKGG